jgi:hypothetical protein
MRLPLSKINVEVEPNARKEAVATPLEKPFWSGVSL